jgi:hypothetical protein
MAWIQTEVHFPRRAKIFTLNRQQATEHGFEKNILLELAEEHRPDALETYLRIVFRMARPELDDFQLTFMRFDYAMSEWEIGVSHRSLPEVADGAMIKREPLFLKEESNERTMQKLPVVA